MSAFFPRVALLAALLPAAGGGASAAQEPALSVAGYGCESVPRPANARLPSSEASDDS